MRAVRLPFLCLFAFFFGLDVIFWRGAAPGAQLVGRRGARPDTR
jgi:hypothetical protein